MRSTLTWTLVVCASFGLAACSSSSQHEKSKASSESAAHEAGEEKEADEIAAKDLVREAKVSLGQALETAMKACPTGIAVAAELEGDVENGKRSAAYEVAFVSGSDVIVVKVDHVTRSVISNAKEPDADEAQEAMDRFKTSGAQQRSLLDLLHQAAPHGAGAPVAIAFSRKRAGEARVAFVAGGEEKKVTVDAKTGKPLDAK
jgi:uncharacterized membrane protein YkoI